MNVRIGINPLTWTNDDLPELGGETPLDVCLAEAREAGFSGVELGHKFPRDPDELGHVLAIHGLSLVSGWYGSRLLERSVADELAAVAPHLELLRSVGSKVMVFAEVSRCVHGDRNAPLSTRPVLAAHGWSELGAKLTEVAEHLAARGVALTYHHHMGTVVESEADVDRLMRATGDAVKLLLDTGHLTYAGGDVIGVIARHGARIRHVHLKDVRAKVLARARAADLPFLEAVLQGVFTVPGDGSIDYDAVLGALAKADYSGWLVVEAEQDPALAHPLTYAKMGYENVVSAAVGAGLFTQELCC
ncbi:myo-inosose-2 dehydratase [Myxococcota bacterium]|nr:myo-inosose-2 dehydratase [Myxococcota bacterium]